MEPSYKIVTRSQMAQKEVVFVTDDDVEELIKTRKEFARTKKAKQKAEKLDGDKTTVITPAKRKAVNETETPKQPKICQDDIELALAALEMGIAEVEATKPSELFDETDESVFKFHVNNTRKKMKQKAEDSVTPVKKKLDSIEAPRLPLSNFKSCLKAPSSPKTNSRVSFLKESITSNGQTPYSLRKREINEIQHICKILEGDDDEEEDEDYQGEESAKSEESEEEDEEGAKLKRMIVDDTPKKRRKMGGFKVGEEYFDFKSSKSLTSGNTIKNNKLTQEDFEKIFKNLHTDEKHVKHKQTLLDEHLRMFDRWEFLLEQNFSVLLYGVGSKKVVLSKFAEHVSSSPVVVVNGYFPSLTIKDVVENVCSVVGISVTSRLHETIDLLSTQLSHRIYVIVNNIDGVMLRHRKAQVVLCRLSKINNIKLIASVDHVNTPLLFDQTILSEYNWAWWDCTTFCNYSDETVYENNILLQNSKNLTLSSLRSVYNSLPKNSKNVFLIILEKQLDNVGNKQWSGISFKDLYRESRQALLVTSDVGLRSQLKEFIDHTILKLKKSPEGEECYVITSDTVILKQFQQELTDL